MKACCLKSYLVILKWMINSPKSRSILTWYQSMMRMDNQVEGLENKITVINEKIKGMSH